MKQKEAEGEIQWIDEECVGFKCECGEVFVVGISKTGVGEDKYYTCPKCGKRYFLMQINKVYEVEP